MEPHALLLVSIHHQPGEGGGGPALPQGCRAARAQNTVSNFQAWNLVPLLTTYLTLSKVTPLDFCLLIVKTDCVLCAKSLQSCLTLCDPMNHSPPSSSVHGILQARILEWVAMFSSRGSS